MPSAINASVPADGSEATSSPLRANFLAAKEESDHGGFAEGFVPGNYTPTPADTKVTSHLTGIDAALGNIGGTITDETYFAAPARAATLPATNFATPDERAGSALIAAVLSFADTPSQAAFFDGQLPFHAPAVPNLTVRIYWMAASATTGSVKWNAQIMALTPGTDNLATRAFPTAQTTTTTAPGTSGIVAVTSIALTNAQADGINPGEPFAIRIERDTSVGGNMTGAAQITGIEIRRAA